VFCNGLTDHVHYLLDEYEKYWQEARLIELTFDIDIAAGFKLPSGYKS